MDPYDHDYERGLRNRRAMLGDAWVDRSTTQSHAFNADFQNFINRRSLKRGSKMTNLP